MWLLVGIVTITILSIYFSERLGKNHLLFNTLLFFVVCGFLLIPSLIIFLILEHYDVVQEYKVIPITLPLLIMGFFAVWATWGKSGSSNKSNTDDKKDDFTAEAIIMTAVLSDDEKSDISSNSNSSGSSSSSSNSDDFFFL